LLIKGHADPRGDSQINDDLSRERAKAVFDTLVKQGVDRDHLEFVGVGAAESGTEPASMSGNRNGGSS